MADNISKVEADRQLLREAQAAGAGPTLGAFVRLSGPGWLQSAITLGGGSLAGALFLGILGGPSLLWLQLVAITMGVVMLSAISYVTLSTGERPFSAIHRHINPALAWGWLIATSIANMIWCMPQFSLCFEALEQNLAPGVVENSLGWKLGVSAVILTITSCVLMLNVRGGAAAKAFDLFIKALIGMIVLCFFGVVVHLTIQGVLDWGTILTGFIPDPRQWNSPSGEVAQLVQNVSAEAREFWSARIVREQRAVMIGAAATAVGINMTFLMPYSMLQRGWDKTFRGLARFDLSTGMAIPYVMVTSCVVIAAAHAFHSKADDAFLSTSPGEFQTSPLFGGAKNMLLQRVRPDLGESFDALGEQDQQAALMAMVELSEDEKLIAASLVQRNAFELSQALAPLLGQDTANLVFGFGIFGMGFSTIIILMFINGFVFREAAGQPGSKPLFAIGCLAAGVSGALWPLIWDGPAKLWLAILTSSFGMMLLPIAYVTFFMLMNSRSIMGDQRPRGFSRLTWNVLMGISVIGAFIAAGTAIYDKITDDDPMVGYVVSGMVLIYAVLVVLGFVLKRKVDPAADAS